MTINEVKGGTERLPTELRARDRGDPGSFKKTEYSSRNLLSFRDL